MTRRLALLLCVVLEWTACSDRGEGAADPADDGEGGEAGEAEGGGAPAGGRGGSQSGGRGGGGGGQGGSGGQGAGAGQGDAGAGGSSPADAGPSASQDAAAPPPGSIPVFAAAGYSGVRIVSRDLGATWVDKQVAGGGGDDPYLLRGIGCGNGLCIAGGGSAGATGWLSITSDGKTWKRFDLGRPGLSDIAFGNGMWVGVSGHYAIRSDDGVSWEVGSDKGALGFGGILRRMTFAGGKFIAWGDGGKRVLSADGRKWTVITSGHAWSFVAHGAGKFIAVGGGRQTSSDGISWQAAGGPDGRWIVWTGQTFVMGGGDMTHSSPDGETWSSQKASNAPGGVAYGAGVFVGYGARSTDGAAWTRVSTGNEGVTDVDFAYLQPVK